MNAQDLSSLIAAAVSQAVSAVTGAEQPVPEYKPSEQELEARAKREASIEADAEHVSQKIVDFFNDLGFGVDYTARLNASWGKDSQFSYNSTRASWERAAERKAYFENRGDEISITRLREIEDQLSEMAARLEQAEITNRACQKTFEKLYKQYNSEVLNHIADHDLKANREDAFLKWNAIPAVSEQAYAEYRAKAEAKYAQQQAKNRQSAVATEQMLQSTERAFALKQA